MGTVLLFWINAVVGIIVSGLSVLPATIFFKQSIFSTHSKRPIEGNLQETNDELVALELEIDRLKEQNRRQNQFLSVLAHDLKGPVGNLSGLVDILQITLDDINKEDLTEISKRMSLSVHNVRFLLDNLLKWGLSRQGALSPMIEKVDTKRCIETAFHPLKTIADEKQVKINIGIIESKYISADPDHLSCILRNIISNAIKFSFQGSRVDINSIIKEDRLHVSISDEGMGINEEILKNLFSPCDLTSTSGAHGEKGHGLGLSLCKELADRNNIEITVKSELDRGTTFNLAIPVPNTQILSTTEITLTHC